MKEMEKILENIAINSWAKHFHRDPRQRNKLHETDAEFIEMPGNSTHYLAATIDTVAEEITTGLYQDPYTMGWVTVMACVSDLAAVGADPLGLLISVSCEPERDPSFIESIAQGMEDACRKLDIFILGGDTNITESISLTACSLGLVNRNNIITRRGCMPGDEVFITGGAGTGNALGLVRLTGLPDTLFPEKKYHPTAHIKAGQILKKYARCCMDTSDGVLTTLDQLMRLNDVGFTIDCQWENILAPEVMALCKKTNTPPWMMLAGLHGEFVLLCSIPKDNVERAKSDLEPEGVQLIRLGEVEETPKITLSLPTGKHADIDMAPVRNLLQTVGGDLDLYVKNLWDLGRQWGLNKPLKIEL